MHRALGRLCNVLNVAAAVWLIAIAIVIFLEVTGRGLFGLFLGGDEIVKNSVPAIVFMQVPLAIHAGTMLRTTIVFANLSRRGRLTINAVNYTLGLLFFAAIAIGGWPDMVQGWEIGEYQGIGALEVPVYPIRTIIVISGILTALIYLVMILKALTGTDATPGVEDSNGGASHAA
jgi:TRAP-type C4-dicarboxylate transport system permease small subunit